MKKIFKKISIFLIALVCGLGFFACAPFGDEENPDVGFSIVQTVYKNDTNSQSALIEEFANNIMTDIMTVYGYDSSGSLVRTLLNDSTLVVEKFYDAFRFVFSDTETLLTNSSSSSKWNWTFSSGTLLSSYSGTKFDWNTADDIFDTPSYKTTIENYKTAFTPAIKIICFEVALGKTPSTVVVNSMQTSAMLTINGLDVATYLEQIKQEYINNSQYTGLTQTNVDAIKQYIKENMIGSNALSLSNSSKSLVPDNGTEMKTFTLPDRKYDEVIDAIFDKNYTTQFQPKANSTYQTYMARNLSAIEIENDDYAPAQQYQSIVLNSNSIKKLEGLSFMVYSEEVLELDISINIYDLKNGTKLESTLEPVSLEAKSTDGLIMVDAEMFDAQYFQVGTKFFDTVTLEPKDLTDSDNAEFDVYSVSTENETTLVGIDPTKFESTENYIFELCFNNKTNTAFRFGIFVIGEYEE